MGMMLLWVGFCIPRANAQVYAPTVIWVLTAPSGACASYAPMQLLISTNPPALYSCNTVTNMWGSPAGAQGPAGPAGPVGSSAKATLTGDGSMTTLDIAHNFGTVTHSGPTCWDETSAAPYPEISGVLNTFGTNTDTVTLPIAPYAGQSIACYETSGGGGGSTTLTPGTTPTSGGAANQLMYDTGTKLGEITACANGVYSTNGSSVPSCGTTLPSGLTAGAPFTVGSGGVAGALDLGQGTLPSLGTNSFSWFAPTAVTSYGLIVPSTVNSAGQVLSFGAPSSGISTGSWITPAVLGANNFTGLQNVTLAPGAATVTDGYELYNTTAATSGAPQQYSPALAYCGQAWNSTATASQAGCVRSWMQPQSGTTPPVPQFTLDYSTNGGAWTNLVAITPNGATFSSSITSANALHLQTFSVLQWSSSDTITSNTNGQLAIANHASNAPGIAATASGDVSACYNTTSFQLTQGSVCGTSLRRYKKDFKDANGLDYIMRMRPVIFTWKTTGKRDIGLIADDVAKIDPLLGAYDPKGKLYNFRDREVLATAVKAIQELKQENDGLKRRIAALEAK